MTIKLITRLHAVFVVMILTSGCSRQTERLKARRTYYFVRGLMWKEKRKKKATKSETRGGKKSTVYMRNSDIKFEFSRFLQTRNQFARKFGQGRKDTELRLSEELSAVKNLDI